MAELKSNDHSRTPLADMADTLANASSSNVALKEAPLCCQITIRAKSNNAEAFQAVKRVTGMDLPTAANTFVEENSLAIYWTGPTEWLLTAPDAEATELLQRLALETRDLHVSLVDVSDNRTRLVLSGSESWSVMNKTCSLDVRHNTWARGHCAQTLIGRAQVLLAMASESTPEFHLFVRNSFSRYLAEFLIEAMAEFAAN